MCGFLCLVNYKENLNSVRRKLHNISNYTNHRGPDKTSFYFNDKFSVLFRRLSIIDLTKKSDQPITSKNNRYIMAFNGEIYNYLELKKILEKKGYKFFSRGDSEVLLNCFVEWGENFIEKIRGMFSFCIWDKNLNKFYAFRDRFGQKPLFYHHSKLGLIVSSEIKDINYFIEQKNENIDISKKYIFMSFCDNSKNTFFKNIFRLLPSRKLIFKNKKINIYKYWSLKINENKQYDIDEFKNNFLDTVNIHTKADVKIAYLLSGGLDSSSIIAAAKHLGNEINSFSIIPKNTFNERPYINSFVKKLNINHDYIYIKETRDNLDVGKVLYYHDEPIKGSECIYQYLLRKEINQRNYKVLIGGEGGDEVLGGYKRMFIVYLYTLFNQRKFKEFNDCLKKSGMKKSFIKREIKRLKNIINKKISDREDKTGYEFLIQQKKNKYSFLSENWNDLKTPSKFNFFKQSIYNSITYNDINLALRMEDRNCMSFGIENRVPFLDHKFVEYIFSIKYENFVKDGIQKYMLRESIRDLSDEFLVNREKKSGRPGNDNHYIFDIVFDEFIDLLGTKKLNSSFLNHKALVIELIKERKKRSYTTSGNFYFRVYNYLKWKHLKL